MDRTTDASGLPKQAETHVVDPAGRPEPSAMPPLPEDEAERLRELDRYGILDTEPEDTFDDLTRLAAFTCGAPIALVSLIDAGRQWFKSRHGLSITETCRDFPP